MTYTDNFGMPKTDNLGRLVPPPPRASRSTDDGTAPGDPSVPPAEVREIVMRLCDDKTLHHQIRRAIDRRLEELGNQAFGDRLTEHAVRQHELHLPFHNEYYFVLAGNEDRNLPGYLQEIGWRPSAGVAAASTAGPICGQCGIQFPPGALFCPQHGATLTMGGSPAGALKCAQCGQLFPAGTQFCPQHGPSLVPVTTGSAAPAPSAVVGSDGAHGSIEDRLQRLKTLLDQGLISAEDFSERKGQILAEI